MFSIIVATDLKNGIGVGNRLPWHLPNDLKHFKTMTLGKPVLMGRKTFLSIGKPLPQRRNLVISRGGFTAPGIEVFYSIEQAINALAAEPEIMVIGGGMLYEALMSRTSVLYRTLVHTTVEADTFFPEIDLQKWRLDKSEPHQKDAQHAYDYTFETWIRME